MSIYLIAFLAVTIPFLAGYYLGCADGKVEGRMAVRRHYEGILAADRKICETHNHQLINSYKDQA